MKRVEHLEKKGIKSVWDMPKERLEWFISDKLNLNRMREYFLLTGRPWCVFEVYDFKYNKKTEFYITQETLNDILSV